MLSGLHGDGNVGDSVINTLLGAGQRLVAEDNLAITLVRHEVVGTVLANKSSQALAHIQEPELCP